MMSISRSLLLFLALSALLSMSSVAVAQAFPQPESTVTCGSSPVLIGYGEHAINCSITATSFHAYQFVGTQGDVVFLSLLSSTPGWDARMRIFNPIGTLIEDAACNTSSGLCLATESFTLSQSGIYTVSVFDGGNDEAGVYDFSIHRTFPNPPSPLISYGMTVTDEIMPATDYDYVSFFGQAGDFISVSLEGLAAGLDIGLEITDSSGNVVRSFVSCSSSSNPCTLTLSPFFLSSTDTFTILVADDGLRSTGNYELTVDCQFGPSCGPGSTRRYPGTSEDFEILSSIGGGVPTSSDLKQATGGDVLSVVLRSPSGLFANNTAASPVLAAEIVTSASGPNQSTSFPELWISLTTGFVLYDGTVGSFGLELLPPGGLYLQYVVPLGLTGSNVFLQGFLITDLASNGFFMSTDAHELQF